MMNSKLLSVISSEILFKRGARWIKPYNNGPKEYWNKGIPNYDWQRGRGRKFSLPKDHLTIVADSMKSEEEFSPEERRTMYKEKGISPPRMWFEQPIFIGCTSTIMEAFVPPEGDGKASLISKERASQEYKKLLSKGKNMRAIGKIRSYKDFFDPNSFAERSLEIYKKAHEALMTRDKEELLKYVTEKCYPEMTRMCDFKTIRWQYLKSLEKPCITHARCIINKESDFRFAQITVRTHSQQTLAVYDRFGRLIYGDEAVVKDVLEYVVYEIQLNNIYSDWRIHGKIVPSWMPPRAGIPQTFVKEELPEIPPLVASSAEVDDEAKEVSTTK
ncbi:mitochondrial ribosomal protein L45 [Brevipalpus obovatus]|uniref:mitochondrial ribosomal protein L45 n=1 Tax=Brevipalpus obovatus TaxID=246614 RepID=UPI003D9E429D